MYASRRYRLGAPPTLKYSVHIETDAPAPAGDRLLDYYSLTTRETVDTVFLAGTLPNVNMLAATHRTNSRNVQFYVQFVVTVPATFSLDISTGLGDIEMADIDGHVSLVTQGETLPPAGSA